MFRIYFKIVSSRLAWRFLICKILLGEQDTDPYTITIFEWDQP